VLLLDDVGDWRGLGTALHLAEAGHEVTILTAAPTIGAGLTHSAADGPLRKRFARAGGHALTSVALVAWAAGQGTLESTLTGERTRVDADALVIAETPVAETALGDALTAAGIAHRQIGDCLSPRRASLAFYEGRELARRL
jgi:NADPH-dependent 2,4-dienoyl-CoA reductase/sulfur reductase-like enzyme